MNLYEKIITLYPELTDQDFVEAKIVELRDDSDGFGPYLSKWNYGKPIPQGLSVGKPASE
jgi:hypothetical protein